MSVAPRERSCHRLVETMIDANVAAAKALAQRRR